MLNALVWLVSLSLMLVCVGFLAVFVVLPIVYPVFQSEKEHTYPYCEYCEREADWTERAAQDGVTLRRTPTWICYYYSLSAWDEVKILAVAAVVLILATGMFAFISVN